MVQSSQTILVVDDHEVIRRSLNIAISAMGDYKIIEAQDGNEAFEFLLNHPCDLVFCDLNMPQGDGLSLISAMAEIACKAPLVLMSAEEIQLLQSAQVLAAKYGLQVIDIVEKPVSAHQINQLIALSKLKRKSIPAMSQQELSVKQLKEVLDEGYLKPYFQPQLCIRSNKITGLEVLARIEHPELGLISPLHFIALAESTGLMNKLTMQVVTNALACVREWHAMGFDLNIAINLSASTLEDPQFPERLIKLVNHYGVKPENVTCELTENILADDPFAILKNMIRLRMMKFQLAIDDFGTGFASMEQLHEMPLQELKLDRSFIQDLPNNPRAQSIVKSNLHLAQGLSMKTVAEGVEDAETLSMLAALNCDFCQGYYISPPIPAMAVCEFIRLYDQQPFAQQLESFRLSKITDKQA